MTRATATLVASIVLATGCATVDAPVANENYGAAPAKRASEPGCESAKPTSPSKRGSSEVCFVGAGPLTPPIKVADGHAYSESLFGDREIVSMDSAGTIYEVAMFGNREVGEFRCGKLIRRQLLGDTVAATIGPETVVSAGLLGRTYSRGAGCDDAEAALGALALMIIEERDDEAAKKKQEEEAERRRQEDSRRMMQRQNSF